MMGELRFLCLRPSTPSLSTSFVKAYKPGNQNTYHSKHITEIVLQCIGDVR
jgi:hypothetical protein